MPRDPECTFALLQLGEKETISSITELKRTLGSAPTLNLRKDFAGRLHSAAGVVIQRILQDACEYAGINLLNAQFDELPTEFHITVTFGQCLVISTHFLLKEEGYTLDARPLGLGMVDALLFMRSDEDKKEQYVLGNTLLKRFIAAGPKANEWQNNLNSIVSMYLLSSNDEKLQKYNYKQLFGSMLKTLIAAVELPS